MGYIASTRAWYFVVQYQHRHWCYFRVREDVIVWTPLSSGIAFLRFVTLLYISSIFSANPGSRCDDSAQCFENLLARRETSRRMAIGLGILSARQRLVGEFLIRRVSGCLYSGQETNDCCAQRLDTIRDAEDYLLKINVPQITRFHMSFSGERRMVSSSLESCITSSRTDHSHQLKESLYCLIKPDNTWPNW